jgi:hypothetical protein
MFAITALLGLMLLTWTAAVWASFQDESESHVSHTADRRLKAA